MQIVYIFANINYLHYYITKKEGFQVYNDVNEQIKNALLKRATGYEVEEKEIIIDKKNPTCYIFYRTMTFSKGKVCEKGVPWGLPFRIYIRNKRNMHSETLIEKGESI